MGKEGVNKYKPGTVIEGALGIVVPRYGCSTVEILKYEEREIISLMNADPAFIENPDNIENELLRLVEIPKRFLVLPSDCETLLDEKRRREEIKGIEIRLEHCFDEMKDQYQQQLTEKERGNIFKIELITDEELVGLINRDRLFAFIEKYGIPLETGYSYKSKDIPLTEDTVNRILVPTGEYNQPDLYSVIGYASIRMCGRILIFFAFAEVLGAIGKYGITDENTMCAFAFFEGLKARINLGRPQFRSAASGIIADAYAKNTNGISSRTSRLSVYVKLAFENDMRSLGFTFSSRDDRPIVYARDYFSYLAYDLLVKWNAALDGKKTKGIYKKCEGSECNNLFWADRRNKKYCKYCDRRREYAQTDKAKEKRREKIRVAKLLKEKEGEPHGADN